VGELRALGHARADLGGALDRGGALAAGAVLYRDVQSPYGPLPDYVVAAGFRLFGTRLAVAVYDRPPPDHRRIGAPPAIARRFCAGGSVVG
jgi:hypothetical protein